MHLKKIVHKAFKPEALQPNKKMKTYKCQYCGKTYAYQVSRMAKHLRNSCISCPASIKRTLKNKVSPKLKRSKKRSRKSSSSSEENSLTDDTSIPSDAGEVSKIIERTDTLGASGQQTSGELNTQAPASSSRKNIATFFDKISKIQQADLEEKLSKAIFASGCPLNITENVFWREFFQALRPSFNMPSRHQISNRLLNEVYEKVKLNVDEKVRSAEYIGLQCDGWSNIRNEGIINFIITTPDPVFYKTIATSTNSQTAQYIADQMKSVIDVVGPEKIFGVCTDNAAAMKSTWEILGDQYQSQNIAFYGCGAHILNLLIKDVASQPSIETVTKNATAIVKEIKEKHVLSAVFAEIQKKDPNKTATTLKLPVKTRFGSVLFCLESLLENKQNLQSLAISPQASSLKQLTKNVILDDEFWTRTVKTLVLLKPVGKWITILEGDNPKLSAVPEAFYELKDHFVHELADSSLRILSDAESKQLFSALEKRRLMAVRPIHFAANILDPFSKGRHLSDVETVDGAALIFELGLKFQVGQDAVLEELTEYQTCTGIWGQEYVKRAASVVSPEKWWKGICGSTKLSKIAVATLSLPATSAATERSFSTFGWIHSTKRNRLSTVRAGMITYIAHNLRLLRPKDNVQKRQTEDADPVSDTDEEADQDGSSSEGHYEDLQVLEDEAF